MPNDDQFEKGLREQLHAAAENTWRDHSQRRQFERIGVSSAPDLEKALDKAIRDPQTRSFDRQQDGPIRDQSERTTIFQATIEGRNNQQHQVTVILSPEKDQQGQLREAKAHVNSPNKPTGLSQELESQYREQKDPKVLMRGGALSLSEDQSLKSPISRLGGTIGGWGQPTNEREKQVTPVQEQKAAIEEVKRINTPKPGMSLLNRLEQAKPDISKEVADRERQRQMSRSHELSR